MATRRLPDGTVTLLFTDVEGSTRLLQELGREAYVEALTTHRRLLREAVASHGGVEVEMQGDSFHFAFPSARDAVAAAVAAQRALHEHPWATRPIEVRLGLHTGEPMQADALYAGLDVHRAARVMSAGHGGQILLSDRTADLVEPELPPGIELVDLGAHRLKDLTAPQRLYQVSVASLRADFPPLQTLPSSRTNLPVQPTPLVGREDDLRELTRLLERPEVRLVTLTGPGGTGKTRLALHLAADRSDDYPDGVYACFLSAIRDPALVLPAVAAAIAVRDQPGRPLADVLADHLSTRRLLLVLDNLEHLLEATPELAQLRAGAPELTIVATSRAPLRLAGEHRYDVPPLSVPGRDTLDRENLQRSEAVVLFCERARAARPDFELTPENALDIAEICRRLDGLPLALELAAARIDFLPPHGLLARLERRLPLLSSGRRDADERQRTLDGAIAWSYDLLDESERALFRRLSVLLGAFTVEAAEAVAAGADALEGLASLHEKSLLRRREGPGVGNDTRFFLLETIREYAAERLVEHGERGEVERRRTRYFLGLAEQGASRLMGPDQLLWLDRLEAEHDNLRAALAHALDAEDVETVLRLVGALFRFWDLRGHPREGLRWAQAALALDGGSEAGRATASFAAGFNSYSLGDAAAAVGYFEAALTAYNALGDERGVALSLAELAWSRLRREEDDGEVYAVALDSLALARATGDRWCEALALQAVAVSGDAAKRKERLHECDAIFREVGDEIYAARVLQNLCVGAMRDGEFDEALDLAERALASSRRLGDVVLVAANLLARGEAQLLGGDVAGAADSLREGLEAAVRVGIRLVAVEALWALGAVAAAGGEPLRAGRLVGVAERVADEIGYPLVVGVERMIEERFLHPVRLADPEAFDAARARGRELQFEAGVACALEDVRAVGATRR